MVRILNPLPNGKPTIGLKHAERYVRSRRAEWVTPTTIRFDESDERYRIVLEHLQAGAAGYDARGMMTRAELRHIPLLFPERMR